jgi:hypothetical protein
MEESVDEGSVYANLRRYAGLTSDGVSISIPAMRWRFFAVRPEVS